MCAELCGSVLGFEFCDFEGFEGVEGGEGIGDRGGEGRVPFYSVYYFLLEDMVEGGLCVAYMYVCLYILSNDGLRFLGFRFGG